MLKSFLTRMSTICLVVVLSIVASTVYGGERVLVVGDSITGHSMNLEYGFAREIRALISETESDVEFVPLGGSGQTIFSWRGIIKSSKENKFQLDIRDIIVKDEFDKGADVLLVHLGMNDALQPSIKSDEEGFRAWKAEYIAFVADLRDRVPNVKKIILTPPTALTENPYDFKNVFMDRLAEIVQKVAKETNCEFYDARKDFMAHFINARMVDPNFRITLDFVHPNQCGHQIMSWSFLKALGYVDLADKYYQEKVDPILRPSDKPALCAFVNDVAAPRGALFEKARGEETPIVPIAIQVKTRALKLDAKNVSSDVATVKSVEPTENDEYAIALEAPISALPGDVAIRVDDVALDVHINAPYFVATGFPFEAYPKPEEFPREKASTPIDDAIRQGLDPLARAFKDAPDGFQPQWYYYYPTPDKTGAANPNAVDLAALPPANAFDAGYVVRYVVSPKAQKAMLKLNSEGFSTTAIETIYLNGEEIYFDCLSPRHIKAKDEVEVQLREGVNVMTARVDHTNWQWGTSFSFENAEGLSF